MLPTQYYTQNYGALIFNHVNDNTFYSDVSDLNAAAARIVTALTGKNKPYFYLAGYQRFRQDDFTNRSDPGSSDISVQRLSQLQSLLKANTSIGQYIEIVTPEVFSYLLRKKLGLVNVDEKAADKDMTLSQNYPNPFNSITTISYSIPAGRQNGSEAAVKVYDILGREVAYISNIPAASGRNSIEFIPSRYNLPGGMYIYRLTAGGETLQRKMLYIK